MDKTRVVRVDRGALAPEDGRPTTRRPRLGELLLAEDLVTEAEVEAALEEQRRTGARLGDVLVARGAISARELTAVLGSHFGVDFVDLDEFSIDEAVARSLPEHFERSELVLPIAREGDELLVAFADPGDVLALDDAQTAGGLPVRRVIAEPSQLKRAINRVWHRSTVWTTVQEAEHHASLERPQAPEPPPSRPTAADAPIVRLVTEILSQAVREGASDVHVDPEDGALRIRFRVDGVIRDAMEVPPTLRSGLVSRLKVMSGLDISERRRPQDGRTSLEVDGHGVDFRVASLPTSRGEALSLRILDRGPEALTLDDLGFPADARERYARAFHSATGAIAVTGPTGSGKTTTLYATLRELNRPDRRIVTVEDPVEHEIPGIKQIPINPRANLTFSTALRSILRADPDVIMIGEVRDRETAVITAEAAITGHLVLTTLHTKDATSVPLRLVEMGVEPYLVSAALGCVVAQRLVRRLCDACRLPTEVDHRAFAELGFSPALLATRAPETLARPVGCSQCSSTGYRGRIGLFEVMPISEEIGHLVATGAPADAIRRQAVTEGMTTLRDAGLHHVLEHTTSPEELLRVLG